MNVTKLFYFVVRLTKLRYEIDELRRILINTSHFQFLVRISVKGVKKRVLGGILCFFLSVTEVAPVKLNKFVLRWFEQ